MIRFLNTLCFVTCFFMAVLPFGARSQSAVFNVTYNGFTPQAQTAFQYAANRWSGILQSSVPIKVNAYFIPLLPGMLGITFPNGRRDFNGAPLPNTWYATSLANAITGTEQNPGESDFDLYLNASAAWYFDTAGAVPSSQYDFVSVAMHEMCHGFGFVSLAKKTGTVGSFGLLQATDFAPLTTTFPWPDLDTLPSVYDRLLVKNTGAKLDTFPNPSTALGAALTSNNVYIAGTYAVLANNDLKPRAYAPVTFSLGSSTSHLNESTYPAGNANEMMTPDGTPGNANHDPGPVALGVLRDIGWHLNPALSSYIPATTNTFRVFPNPTQDVLTVTGLKTLNPMEVCIRDLTGRIVLTGANYRSGDALDVSSLRPGFYYVVFNDLVTTTQVLFVKQ